MSYIGQTGRIYIIDTGNIYVTSGTMTPNLPTHSINLYYKIYTNMDLLQTLCPYTNPYIRRQCKSPINNYLFKHFITM